MYQFIALQRLHSHPHALVLSSGDNSTSLGNISARMTRRSRYWLKFSNSGMKRDRKVYSKAGRRKICSNSQAIITRIHTTALLGVVSAIAAHE